MPLCIDLGVQWIKCVVLWKLTEVLLDVEKEVGVHVFAGFVWHHRIKCCVSFFFFEKKNIVTHFQLSRNSKLGSGNFHSVWNIIWQDRPNYRKSISFCYKSWVSIWGPFCCWLLQRCLFHCRGFLSRKLLRDFFFFLGQKPDCIWAFNPCQLRQSQK